jgi:septal ring factor EnvC (AmiA/AmiB activator)
LVESSVKELAAMTVDLEKKTKEQKSHLRQRLSVIYRLGGAGIARVLFSSSSSTQLERNLKVLGVVAKTDIQLIKDYTKSQRELGLKKLRLTKRWEKLKKIEAKISKKEEKLVAQNEEKMQILEEVKKTQKTALSKLSQIRKKSRQMASVDEEGVLDLLFQASFAEKKGNLERPVEGRLTQGYGVIKDETNQLAFSHRGHLYATAQNSPVKAIFNGVVAFAGEIAGYGQTVILDHGDHYYSVYAHLDNLTVKSGDQVKEREKIAVSGDVSSTRTKGIYFEIRHFSEPSDPKLWMKGT